MSKFWKTGIQRQAEGMEVLRSHACQMPHCIMQYMTIPFFFFRVNG